MNLSELEKLMAKSGMGVCEICGTPFEANNKRRKTCSDPECKRIAHSRRTKERADRLKRERPDEYNAKRNKANKKWRDKKKRAQKREDELKALGERWGKQADFDRKVQEYGIRYGEVSAQKVLANVPKINTNMERGKEDDGENIEE